LLPLRVGSGLIAASLLLAGCGFLPSPTPDWAVCHPNGALACTTLDGVALGELGRSLRVAALSTCEQDCESPVEVASSALELRAPGHPAVTSIDEYTADRHALCGETLCTVSGYLGIFVFTFDDSSAVPIVVSCPGIAACRVTENYGSG
jgi:hypothetical protein